MNETSEIPNIARQLGLSATALSAASAAAAAASNDLESRLARAKVFMDRAAELHAGRGQREALARQLGVDPEQLHRAAARDLEAEIEAETRREISARMPGARYTRTD